MTIPDYQTLMLPVLELAAQRELTNRECVDLICDQFSLSSEEREQLLTSGKQTVISNRIHWAITYLVKAGLIERAQCQLFFNISDNYSLTSSGPPTWITPSVEG